MGERLVISPSVELLTNTGVAAPAMPLLIQLPPVALEIGAREVDLVLSILDDIVLEMQRLQLQSEFL